MNLELAALLICTWIIYLCRKYILFLINLVYQLCFIGMCIGILYIFLVTPFERKQVLKFLIDHL